jgi:pimeloyl-ACP methyl ester carboxylesterase
MTTFLICHGAWSAGWAWKKVRPLLRSAGHDVITPSYTGSGERAHLTGPQVDLSLHIQDVLGVIEYEDLSDFILVGHSYGGMVVTGVADRVPERVRQLVYLDAFVPRNGESLSDLVPAGAAAVPPLVEGWLVPPNPSPPDTSEADLAWISSRRRHQPVRTFIEKLQIQTETPAMPRTYIYCAAKAGGDPFLQFAERLKNDPAWSYVERDWTHSPNVTQPEALAQLLLEIAAKTP